MHIGILTIAIALPGCRSLKEKRQRIGGMHERFGRTPLVAVCESGARDKHDMSEWCFVVVARSRCEVDAQCSQIEEKLVRTIDGRVLDISREFL